jgi:hypothetical protein
LEGRQSFSSSLSFSSSSLILYFRSSHLHSIFLSLIYKLLAQTHSYCLTQSLSLSFTIQSSSSTFGLSFFWKVCKKAFNF